MNHRAGIDDRLRQRLKRAGHRFHTAQDERRAAISELKKAVVDADGRYTAADVAELTGVSSQLLEVIQPELRATEEPP